MKFKFKKYHYFTFAYFLYGCISLLFIYRSKFTIGNTLFFSLIDDEMISMRYAYNLAHGYGLGWNQYGEKVEGITNLLWTVYMAFFHMLPIPLALTSLFIQLSCVIFLIVNLYYTKKLADLVFEKNFFISIVSVLLLVFYIHLLKWGIYGTEVTILTLLTTTGLYYTCLAIKQKKINLLFFFVLGAGTLIRLDFFVIIFVISVFLFIHFKERTTLYKGYAIVGFFLLSQVLWRMYYYGFPVPNTYYLKMTGYPIYLRITNGIYVTIQFITEMHWPLFFIPLFSFIKKNKYLPLLLSAFLAQLLYNIYIGGDMGDHVEVGSTRFIAVVMPIFFITFSAGIWFIKEAVMQTFPTIHAKVISLTVSVFLVCSVVSFNVVLNENTYGNFFAHREIGIVPGNKFNIERALLIDGITTPDARIAVHWAGTTPYFSRREYIDLFGKSDKIIAHEDVNVSLMPNDASKFIFFNPGHTKWNYAYSVLHLRPDITDFSPDTNMYKLVNFDEHKLYLLKNSKNIKWEKIKELQKKGNIFHDSSIVSSL